MGSKYNGPIKRGSLVYLMHTWGDNMGKPDFDHLYNIRSIGPKQVTLDPLNKDGSRRNSIYTRGHTYRLYDRAYHERQRQGGSRSLYPYEWSMLLYPAGDEGWDPIYNF